MLTSYGIRRIEAALTEIQKIKQTDFPYSDSYDALTIIQDLLQRNLNTLHRLSRQSDPAIIQTACTLSRDVLAVYLPFLGFVLRSTNVRNAFEVYGPLLRLSKQLLGNGIKLILSSEWDYSPYTYHNIKDLPDHVLIGLPASESDNPLLLPLAGHELGHSVWVARQFSAIFRKDLVETVVRSINARWTEFTQAFPNLEVKQEELQNNLFALQFWSPIVEWALNQSEETFCDFVGLKIFGESYIHAFAYLLAPGGSDRRVHTYPDYSRRAYDLMLAAKSYGVEVPQYFESIFKSSKPPADYTFNFMISVADESAESLVPALIDKARMLFDDSSIPAICDEEVNKILKRFQLLVPAQKSGGLPNIIAAGWKGFLDETLWTDNKQIKERKNEVLRDLILKSVEVLEIEQILEH